MAKQNEKEATTWGGKMKEFGGGNFTFLSTDGETLIFIVVGLPVLMEGTYKGKSQERVGCPIVTDEGFQYLYVVNVLHVCYLSKRKSLRLTLLW